MLKINKGNSSLHTFLELLVLIVYICTMNHHTSSASHNPWQHYKNIIMYTIDFTGVVYSLNYTLLCYVQHHPAHVHLCKKVATTVTL